MKKIDLILMDRNLPGIEGTTFINEIKKKGFKSCNLCNSKR